MNIFINHTVPVDQDDQNLVIVFWSVFDDNTQLDMSIVQTTV